MTTLTEVNEEAVLATGRTIQWTRQAPADALSAPSSVTSGVAVNKPVSVYLAISTRETLHHRTARLTVDTFDAVATYTVTVNGTPANLAATSDPAAVVTGLRDAINAAVGATVTASALDASGEDVAVSGLEAVELLITGNALLDYSIVVSATGTGELACVADAASATGQLYIKPSGAAASSADTVPGWLLVAGAGDIAVDQRGYLKRINAAGAGRLHLQLDGIRGHVDDASIDLRPPNVDFGIAVTG